MPVGPQRKRTRLTKGTPVVGSAQLLLVVDWLELGVMLVSEQAVVLHVNRAAGALLDVGDALRSVGGAVACHAPDETRRLHRPVHDAGILLAVAGPGCLLAVHRRPGLSPLSVLVAPLGR